jgi:hypothetical protein
VNFAAELLCQIPKIALQIRTTPPVHGEGHYVRLPKSKTASEGKSPLLAFRIEIAVLGDPPGNWNSTQWEN